MRSTWKPVYLINLYLNNEDIRFLEGEKTAVQAGDELAIIPAVAGGHR
jgi:molybdopterin synthase sulfur carrier subunit